MKTPRKCEICGGEVKFYEGPSICLKCEMAKQNGLTNWTDEDSDRADHTSEVRGEPK